MGCCCCRCRCCCCRCLLLLFLSLLLLTLVLWRCTVCCSLFNVVRWWCCCCCRCFQNCFCNCCCRQQGDSSAPRRVCSLVKLRRPSAFSPPASAWWPNSECTVRRSAARYR